jgi:DNA-binding NarL/FixJ family response regulator
LVINGSSGSVINFPLRCLLVEDQLLIQQLLADLLQRQSSLEIVGAASTAAAGIAACAQLQPDLVILDLALPDADGISVARALQVIRPQARVIVLSSFASTLEWPLELHSQLIAIIDKARAFQDLLQAIATLLPPEQAAMDDVAIDCSGLTNREHQVLRLIGRGLRSQAIATELGISPRTVETHRHSIRTKLGLSGAALVHQATLLNQSRWSAP